MILGMNADYQRSLILGNLHLCFLGIQRGVADTILTGLHDFFTPNCLIDCFGIVSVIIEGN